MINGVGLTTVGTLLGHHRRETTAIYVHLDDAAPPQQLRGNKRSHSMDDRGAPLPKEAATAIPISTRVNTLAFSSRRLGRSILDLAGFKGRGSWR